MKWVQHSLRNKLIVFLLAATIVPITASIVLTYSYTKETVAEESVKTNAHLLFQGKTNLINYLETIRKASFSLDNDPTILDMLIYPKTTDDYANFLDEKEIFRFLQSVAHTVPENHQVYFYLQERGEAYSVIADNFRRNRNAQDKAPKLDAYPVITVEGTHPRDDYGFDNFPYVPRSNVISLHRVILDAPSTDILGTLSIDFKPDRIFSISEQLYTVSDEDFYILDKNGGVVYSPYAEEIGTVLKDDWVQTVLAKQAESGSYTSREDDFTGISIFERVKTSYLDWVLVKRIPDEVLYKGARELAAIHTMVFIAFLLVVIVATVYISFRVTAPIKQLIGYINRIKTGNLQVEIEVKGSDELAILGTRFAAMMRTINELILREYRLELANKTNELKALQSQINPHFINNAMQSIGTLALQRGDKQIYSLISALGKMMRYSMNTNDSIVPLSAEADHVKAYFNLQKQRFGPHLQCSIEIEREALAVKVPKMILQPLAENYFKHGFDPAEPEPLFSVKGQLSGDAAHRVLHLEVLDNGKGIAAADLAELKRRLHQVDAPGSLAKEQEPGALQEQQAQLGKQEQREPQRQAQDEQSRREQQEPQGQAQDVRQVQQEPAVQPSESSATLPWPPGKAKAAARDSIGLLNVWSRLRLYFDKEARIEVDSVPDGGFRVQLWIPVSERIEVDESTDSR